MFGNYAEREVEGGFYFRNPHNRGGVNDGGLEEADVNGDGVLTTNEDGDVNEGYQLLLVGDLTGNMTGNCPTGIRAGEIINGNTSYQGYNVLDNSTYSKPSS